MNKIILLRWRETEENEWKAESGSLNSSYIGSQLPHITLILDHHAAVKVSVNENFSTLLDFVLFFFFLAWVGPKFYFGRKRKPESAF